MDLEARAHSEHPEELRLWLRLLTCTQLVEKQVRTALREQFDVAGDRRAWRVRLTPKGREAFEDMARAHEGWIVESFAGLDGREITQLHRLLGKVKSRFQEEP
jgi:DNA-binding MarR family transcriptional regulator